MDNIELKIFVSTRRSTEEGHPKGEWIDLPSSDLDEALERIAEGYYDEEEEDIYDVEFVINDYESDDSRIKVKKDEDIYELNDFVDEVDSLDEHEFELFDGFLDDYGKEEALKKAKSDDGFYIEALTLTELGENYIYEVYGGVEGLDRSTLENHFDYESFGQDLSYDGTKFKNGYYFE